MLNGWVQGKTEDVIWRTLRADINGLAAKGKVSGLECSTRHGSGVGKRRGEAFAFVVGKPESSVALDGPACRASKGVANVRILWHGIPRGIQLVIEEVACAQRVITSKPVEVELKIVRAALAHDVNHGSGVAAKLGKEVVREDAKFLDGIRVERGQSGLRLGQPGNFSVIVVGAVEEKIVVSLARAVHGETLQQGITLDSSGRK